jgi:hypothetical protein
LIWLLCKCRIKFHHLVSTNVIFMHTSWITRRSTGTHHALYPSFRRKAPGLSNISKPWWDWRNTDWYV